jgi:hypothetical protein
MVTEPLPAPVKLPDALMLMALLRMLVPGDAPAVEIFAGIPVRLPDHVAPIVPT